MASHHPDMDGFLADRLRAKLVNRKLRAQMLVGRAGPGGSDQNL